ncbi:Protein of unknown function (DUF2530) [Parafrankia irregularis]|uniref:DUF2530 domain-containing protein n=1 Tax=Parafrankia irregularis TaxID=795642 RepID=A0A0S4QQH8_9ACTN|nr:Protein of unknown function (DUF2530) [Parafrankia irregularis]
MPEATVSHADAPDVDAPNADVPGGGGSRPAELQALPYDGVRSVAVGSVVWLVALLVMIPFADDLRDDGRLWWIATAAVGFGLGLAGLWIVIRRRDRLRAAEERSEAEAEAG